MKDNKSDEKTSMERNVFTRTLKSLIHFPNLTKNNKRKEREYWKGEDSTTSHKNARIISTAQALALTIHIKITRFTTTNIYSLVNTPNAGKAENFVEILSRKSAIEKENQG